MNSAGRAASALIFVACSLSPARSADTIDADTMSGVQVFLDAYQTLSQARSPVFYELYSDRAQVLTEVPGRAPMRFLGMNYKAWGKDLISRAQAFPDASRFETPQIERHGAYLHVQARRYSLGRCYLDQRYSLTLEPVRNGYQIIEEHLALQPAARCGPETGAGSLPAMATGLAPSLPRVTWHPMSADEINATAVRLAQQVPRQAEPPRSPRPAPTPVSSGSHRRSDLEGERILSRRRSDHSARLERVGAEAGDPRRWDARGPEVAGSRRHGARPHKQVLFR